MTTPRNTLRVDVVGSSEPKLKRDDRRAHVRVLGIGTGVVVCLETAPPDRRKSRRRS